MATNFTQTFTYSGNVQEFTVPYDGLYKLEVYGANGGNNVGENGNQSSGGRGGYSMGYKLLKKGQELYVVCGGGGTYRTIDTYIDVLGGYNGGGDIGDIGDHYNKSSGGGATHIALMSGTLQSIGVSNLSNILIVAGGGGGACATYESAYPGGDGGGFNGGAGTADSQISTGGSQASGGSNGYAEGYFGKGGTGYGSYSGGGGGGLYGGGGAQNIVPGGGGSGYIGGVPSITYRGVTYVPETVVGANQTGSHGWAVITLVEKDMPTMYVGEVPVVAIYIGNVPVTDIKF